MPVIFRYKSFRFFFYSNEGNPGESVHVHVLSNEGEAKFWLKPHVCLSNSHGFNAQTLRELTDIIEQNATLIERTWHEYFD